MVQDWEKILYDFARPNNFSPFLMPKGKLRDYLVAACYHLHGEKIPSSLNLAGKSEVRAHCWKLEPVEMRHKILAQMVVHWNNYFPKDVLRENKSLQVFKPRVSVSGWPRVTGLSTDVHWPDLVA